MFIHPVPRSARIGASQSHRPARWPPSRPSTTPASVAAACAWPHPLARSPRLQRHPGEGSPGCPITHHPAPL